MAQVQGFLREDKATYGEKVVLNLLKTNLPKDFTVYVECPVHSDRMQNFPDFIILTNYGVIVLEVKDWVQIISADRYKVKVRTRENRERIETNPTFQVRDYALKLQDELKKVPELLNDRRKLNVGWGYGVIFPNLSSIVMTHLRKALGEDLVLNRDDLGPNIIMTRLKRTMSPDRMRALSREEISYIRAVINPTVLIEIPDRPVVILDDVQESLVVEHILEVEPEPEENGMVSTPQVELFETKDLALEDVAQKTETDAQPFDSSLITKTSIRLIRGVAGSGKSLVLTQRAKYLASKFPEWKIAVISFNDDLVKSLKSNLVGYKNIKTLTFHALCKNLSRGYFQWKEFNDPEGWLKRFKNEYPLVDQLGAKFLETEIKWMKDIEINTRKIYQNIERKGRGQSVRLARESETRDQIFDIFEAYNRFLVECNNPDWADVPFIVLKGIEEGKIEFDPYDVILIDEAQDFSPSWFKLIKKVVNQDTGILFMADDPAQSIYRLYSWKEKGIPVVGRTRHLRVPYRNTFEIHKAAFELIRNDETLQQSLKEEGVIVEPDFEAISMRHGPKPLVQKFQSFDDEVLYIRDEISRLLQSGYKAGQIAVLHRRTRGVRKLSQALRGLGVNIDTFHAYKGLEFEAVFLSQIQETFQTEDNNELSDERRLLYMAMTRARQQLSLTFTGILPSSMKVIMDYSDYLEE